MSRLKASTACKLAYLGIVTNLGAAGYEHWILKDKARTFMMLMGTVMWIACALAWGKTERDEKEDV
jgi:hypothetical protein